MFVCLLRRMRIVKEEERERDLGGVVRCRRLLGSIEEEHVSHSSPSEECVHTCPSIGTLGICCTLKLSLSPNLLHKQESF